MLEKNTLKVFRESFVHKRLVIILSDSVNKINLWIFKTFDFYLRPYLSPYVLCRTAHFDFEG